MTYTVLQGANKAWVHGKKHMLLTKQLYSMGYGFYGGL